jgi:hypothetical protein
MGLDETTPAFEEFGMSDCYRCEVVSKSPKGTAEPWNHVQSKLWEYTQRQEDYGILNMSGTLSPGIPLHGITQMKPAIWKMGQKECCFIERAFVDFSREAYPTLAQLAAKLRADFPQDLVAGVSIDGRSIY